MLRQSEGKSLGFEIPQSATGRTEVRTGRVIRSVRAAPNAWQTLGNEFRLETAGDFLSAAADRRSIEVDARLRFQMPGQRFVRGARRRRNPEGRPAFWKLDSDGQRHPRWESNLTGGLRWEAHTSGRAPSAARFDPGRRVTLEQRKRQASSRRRR